MAFPSARCLFTSMPPEGVLYEAGAAGTLALPEPVRLKSPTERYGSEETEDINSLICSISSVYVLP